MGLIVPSHGSHTPPLELYVHRSWTGYCIYQLRLVKEDRRFVVRQAFVNRDETKYAGTDDRCDEKLLP
jgi:hypothetical protein